MRLTSTRRHAIAALVCGCATALNAAAQATTPTPQQQRSFAVVSELGREIGVVSFSPTIGTRINANVRTRLPVSEGVIDKLVLTTARAQLKQKDPRTPVWLVAPLDVDLVPGPLAEGDSVQLPADLLDAARQQGSTHLLLFSRLRADASFRLEFGGSVGAGAGQLEGPGFYVDRNSTFRESDTGLVANGMMATYLYARASLIDLAGSRVVRTRRITESALATNTRGDAASNHPFDAMTTSEKLRTLSELLDREVRRSVDEVALR